ncbi:hypothetical protein K2173_010785 [Erythroxylum novogranatense]|uniref:Glutamine amidotransferase domain-containing protein n=1 Tax=Erythroxylum novogranatense TaxID=1862640 RepID=A0AAV8SS28_9ROSI|nr:hypothetical protein K2173_010785 [Erythroxylum novogranatense]
MQFAIWVSTSKTMAKALRTYIENDRPFLGICLGLQLLFEASEENGPVSGLGLIPGVVGRFDSSNGVRVPHIGWNGLHINNESGILDDIGNRHVYFVHSYRAMPSNENQEWVSSTCNYGDKFIASVRKGNVYAVQFHPEKSGDVGLFVLNRFLKPETPFVKTQASEGKKPKLAKRVIACLDVRTNDKGDLVVTKGDQYDVREHTQENEAVVVSIDPRRVYLRSPNDVEFNAIRVTNQGPNGEEYAWYQCTVNGGREGRPIGAYELAKAVEELGAGEILLNCIDCDGQGKGFDIDLIKLICDAVSIPVIASSGAGSVEHFSEVFTKTNASAALAAGIFHRREVPLHSVKEHLVKEGIEVRI